MALSHVPTFVATLGAGWMTGSLLEHYMPKDHAELQNPKLLWLIVGVVRARRW